MSDRGANALAERIEETWHAYPPETQATLILGTTGLFIPDVSKHEPMPWEDGDGLLWAGCTCGWRKPERGESYFDHVGASND